jgi:hypothetical protein
MRRFIAGCLFLPALLLVAALPLRAQGVTTGSVMGQVTAENGNPVPGASVIAVHAPSGTTYQGLSRADGRFIIPGMRVGGPYTITVSFIGYQTQTREGVTINLGVATDMNFVMTEAALALEGITVTGQRGAVMSSERTGAATAVGSEVMSTLPVISRRIEDFARLTPQYSGGPFGFSFAGQDNRLNNLTIDGSYFNNSFGLAGQPGDRTGVAPVSLEAIEQIQVNIAPFDVRQGNFVGAGVNTVTRSGTNDYRGSLYYQFQGDGNMGRWAKEQSYNPGDFKFGQIGAWASGPIIQNKLFFFASIEDENRKAPATTWRAHLGGEPVGGSVTRVEAAKLDALSAFLKKEFDYETGGYQDYSSETPGRRYLAKLDYNLNERNKFSLRYTHLDSEADVLVSTSSSLGLGGRRGNSNALNFQNSNYKLMENIRSLVGEWNSIIGTNMSNNLIVGFTKNDESRKPVGSFFPHVEIWESGAAYTSFGSEPFTPNNELRYSSLQLQNNFTIHRDNHSFTLGVSAEKYRSENVFYPGSQSVYVYNSLDDFYADANDYIANPNRTVSPVTLRRFQVRYANIPGMEKPLQPLDVFFAGIYGQDEWQVNDKLRLTLGLRLDAPSFGNTAFTNANADGLTFRDEHGNDVKYSSGKLPDTKILFSPRFGFNLDPFGDRSTQVRGGTGIFTGRPAYVWISNQIGNTGVLTGFDQFDNTTNRPFNPNPHHYKPATVTGDPAASYELALTDESFKFNQLWRSNIAVDQRLPWGMIGTAEFLYSKDVNGIYYINANLPEANGAYQGADDRPRWIAPAAGVNANRIHQHISTAVVLKNQNVGYSWNFAASLEKAFQDGFYAKAGYSYGESKNTVGPGSIAAGSWTNNAHAGDPNNPGLGFAQESPGHRAFGAISYTGEYFGNRKTTVSIFSEGRTVANTSYTFSGDANGDGYNNDLIYIPRDKSEMNFQQYTAGGRTFTAAEQADAWEAYIQQDSYLSKNRGKYAERGAVFLPMVYRTDLSITQDIFTKLGPGGNSLQLRADIRNVGNLLNSNWGVAQRLVTNQPLTNPGADAQGRMQYRLRAVNNELITKSLEQTVGSADVYQILFTLRYTFN